ncbi:MAG: sensor histidine kinase [Deltaproteobacteria bacterium]|nr:sensor histidine kinase [Deltaproteobacteria bacterium]
MEKENRDRPRNLTDELDRQLFNFKTLYDVSHELIGLADVKLILKTFLLMTMGNFGAIQGFIMTEDLGRQERTRFEPVGFYEDDHLLLEELANQLLAKSRPEGVELLKDVLRGPKSTMPDMVCVAAFKVDERCSGLLGLGKKLIGEEYSKEDRELLGILVNNLVASLKNARYSEALLKALEEVRVLNSAKDKAISHLSHELMTPIALVGGCLTQLEKRLKNLPEETWEKTLTRATRAVHRLSEIQYEVEDIMKGRKIRTHRFISQLFDQCADEIELLFEEETEGSPIVERIRQRIDELFGSKDAAPVEVRLDRCVAENVETLRSISERREIDIVVHAEPAPTIKIPIDPLEKVVKGLIRNAVENTPDEGRIEIKVGNNGNLTELIVKDYGVGITGEDQARIFEGFYHIQDTMNYATKKPFEFNAGGRGADLLRMKIFSEQFGFKISMTSSRCIHIPKSGDICPGRISACGFCKSPEDCYQSGGTTFSVVFPVQ